LYGGVINISFAVLRNLKLGLFAFSRFGFKFSHWFELRVILNLAPVAMFRKSFRLVDFETIGARLRRGDTEGVQLDEGRSLL